MTADDVRGLLPASIVGDVASIAPIRAGLSGAGVYAVEAARGRFVLRVVDSTVSARDWADQLVVLRRAAALGVAPAVVHVDEAARAVLSTQILGAPLHAALADPAQRAPALTSVVAQLRALHGMDPARVPPRDVVAFARRLWELESPRPGFPAWTSGAGAALDEIDAVLSADPRRVVSHNDLNPSNVLWDGARAWLVDWDSAGLNHPFYDLATLATFLLLDDAAALGLLAAQERGALDARAPATLAALRRLVAIAAGGAFLHLAPDLTVRAATTRADAPTLAACYAEMRAGTLDLQSPSGQVALGLALLRLGTEPA
ncbi:MAG TPA: phosphotransferase [Polyangia bacterium]|nr:phosphotransferase [Polyangia bacterium]